MGIPGLQEYIRRNGNLFSHPRICDITLPWGATLVIDSYSFLFNLNKVHKFDVCAHLNGNYCNIAERLEEDVVELVENMALKLIFVFDRRPVLFSEEEDDDTERDDPQGETSTSIARSDVPLEFEGRLESRLNEWSNFEEFCKLGSSIPQDNLPMPPLLLHLYHQVVRKLRVRYHGRIQTRWPTAGSEGKADELIADICRDGNALSVRPLYYVHSSNSDFIAMVGCPLIFISGYTGVLTGNKHTGVQARRVWRRDIVSELIFDDNDGTPQSCLEEKFVEFCLLLGNDRTKRFDSTELLGSLGVEEGHLVVSSSQDQFTYFVTLLKRKPSGFRFHSTNPLYEEALYSSRKLYHRGYEFMLGPSPEIISSLLPAVAESLSIGSSENSDAAVATSNGNSESPATNAKGVSDINSYVNLNRDEFLYLESLLDDWRIRKMDQEEVVPDKMEPKVLGLLACDFMDEAVKQYRERKQRQLEAAALMEGEEASEEEEVDIHFFSNINVEDIEILRRMLEMINHENYLEQKGHFKNHHLFRKLAPRWSAVLTANYYQLICKALVHILRSRIVENFEVSDVRQLYDGFVFHGLEEERYWELFGDQAPPDNNVAQIATETTTAGQPAITGDTVLAIQRPQIRADIIELIHNNKISFIVGQTGCGKSTRVPIFLSEVVREGVERNRVLVIQPRAVAASTIAAYVRTLTPLPVHCELVSLTKAPLEADIVYTTTNVVIQAFAADAGLISQFQFIIVDEIHLRLLEMDLVGLLLKTFYRKPGFSSTAVSFMSASADFVRYKIFFGETTINGEPSYSHIGEPYFVDFRQFPIHEVFIDQLKFEPSEFGLLGPSEKENEAFLRPTKILFDEFESRHRSVMTDEAPEARKARIQKFLRQNVKPYLITKQVNAAYALIRQLVLLKKARGFLVFLDSHRDVLMLRDKLRGCSPIVIPGDRQFTLNIKFINSELSTDRQEDVVRTVSNNDEILIILSNSEGESSLTYPESIDTVVCCGYSRIKVYNEYTTSSDVVRRWIAQDSAVQRKGRVGRLGPGSVYRLYTKEMYESMSIFQESEVLRVPLSDAVLMLHSVFETNADFAGSSEIMKDLLDPPKPRMVWDAYKFLCGSELLVVEASNPQLPAQRPTAAEDIAAKLSQLTKYARMTNAGKFAAQLPCDAAFGKLIVQGIQLGLGPEAIVIATSAGIIGKGMPFLRKSLETLNDHNLQLHYSSIMQSLQSQMKFDRGFLCEPLQLLNLYWYLRSAVHEFRNIEGLSGFQQLSDFLSNVDLMFDRVNYVLSNSPQFDSPSTLSYHQIGLVNSEKAHLLKVLLLWNNGAVFKHQMETVSMKAESVSYTSSEEIKYPDNHKIFSSQQLKIMFPDFVNFTYTEKELISVSITCEPPEEDFDSEEESLPEYLLTRMNEVCEWTTKEFRAPVAMLFLTNNGGVEVDSMRNNGVGLYAFVDSSSSLYTECRSKVEAFLAPHIPASSTTKWKCKPQQKKLAEVITLCNELQGRGVVVQFDLSTRGVQLIYTRTRCNEGTATEVDITKTKGGPALARQATGSSQPAAKVLDPAKQLEKLLDILDLTENDYIESAIISPANVHRSLHFQETDLDNTDIDETLFSVRMIQGCRVNDTLKIFDEVEKGLRFKTKIRKELGYVTSLECEVKTMPWITIDGANGRIASAYAEMDMDNAAVIQHKEQRLSQLRFEAADSGQTVVPLLPQDIIKNGKTVKVAEDSLLGTCLRPKNWIESEKGFYATSLMNRHLYGLNHVEYVTFLPEGPTWIALVMGCGGFDILKEERDEEVLHLFDEEITGLKAIVSQTLRFFDGCEHRFLQTKLSELLVRFDQVFVHGKLNKSHHFKWPRPLTSFNVEQARMKPLPLTSLTLTHEVYLQCFQLWAEAEECYPQAVFPLIRFLGRLHGDLCATIVWEDLLYFAINGRFSDLPNAVGFVSKTLPRDHPCEKLLGQLYCRLFPLISRDGVVEEDRKSATIRCFACNRLFFENHNFKMKKFESFEFDEHARRRSCSPEIPFSRNIRHRFLHGFVLLVAFCPKETKYGKTNFEDIAAQIPFESLATFLLLLENPSSAQPELEPEPPLSPPPAPVPVVNDLNACANCWLVNVVCDKSSTQLLHKGDKKLTVELKKKLACPFGYSQRGKCTKPCRLIHGDKASKDFKEFYRPHLIKNIYEAVKRKNVKGTISDCSNTSSTHDKLVCGFLHRPSDGKYVNDDATFKAIHKLN